MIEDPQKSPLVQAADETYDVMRALCHESQNQTVTAPELYEVLGNLHGASGYLLAQALRQLSQGLQQSLTDPALDVRQDDGSDPAAAVRTAQQLLSQAAALASDVSDLLSKAQAAISEQSAGERAELHISRRRRQPQITATHTTEDFDDDDPTVS